MDLSRTLLLGFIAGITIVIGLPIGRLRRPMPSLKLILTSIAVGILLFLVWDVFSAAWEPIDGALAAMHEHTGGVGPVLGYGSLFAGGLSAGLLSLVAYDRYLDRVGRNHGRGGPGAMSVQEHPARIHGVASWSTARRLSLLIAVGIGLHNFAEGLAIGQAAASSQIALATLLVIGFGLHNATEGFGIVAPLAGDVDAHGVVQRPSWAFLLSMALIAGGPTFLGTAVGHNFTSEAVSVVFLTLAAGSIVYVVAQLLGVRPGPSDRTCSPTACSSDCWPASPRMPSSPWPASDALDPCSFSSARVSAVASSASTPCPTRAAPARVTLAGRLTRRMPAGLRRGRDCVQAADAGRTAASIPSTTSARTDVVEGET